MKYTPPSAIWWGKYLWYYGETTGQKSEGISLTFALVSSSSLAIASSVGAKTVIAPFVITIIIVLLIGVSITWPFCHCFPSFIEPITSWTLEITVIYSLFNSSSSSSRFSPSSSQSSLSNLVLKAPQPSRGLQGRKGTSWTGWVGKSLIILAERLLQIVWS